MTNQSPRRRMPSTFSAYVLLVLCAASVAVALWRIRIDNRLDRMLDHTTAEATAYEGFLDEYGTDEFIVAALSNRPLFDEASLDEMNAALERLEACPYVVQVSGIPTIFRDRFGLEDPEALEEEMTSTPFFHGLFLSEDATIAGLLIQSEILDEPSQRRELVNALFEALAPLETFGFRVDLVGVPVFNTSLNGLSLRESFRTFPIAAVASLIVLLLVLRSVTAALTVIVCGVITLILTFGFVGVLGWPLNIVTSSLPLILWVLAIANCIHIVCRYQFFRRDSDTVEEAIEEALTETRFPCTISAVTTALGFVSLVVADIGPVRELGVLMAAGLLISLAVNLIMGPTLLKLFKSTSPRWVFGEGGGAFGRLAEGTIRRRYLVTFAFALLVAGGLYSLLYIEGEDDSLSFLPPESQVVLSYDFVTEHLTGVRTLEVLLNTPGSWLNDAYWPAISDFTEKLAALDVVPRVVSPLDFLKKMNQWEHDIDPEYYILPESGEEAEELLGLLDEDDDMEIGRLVSDSGEQIRLSVLVRSLDGGEFDSVMDTVHLEGANLPDPLSYGLTGVVQRMSDMGSRMITTQLKSFSLAFAMVFLAILLGLRSLRITLVSVVPNMMPILAAFTTMAILNIPLDPATVMVASIALGIAVDDTVHLLSGYRRLLNEGTENLGAIRGAMISVGPSVSVTTVTACIGFFTLTRSLFVPIAYFGLLSGIAMVVALAADLLLVPAMLAFQYSSVAAE